MRRGALLAVAAAAALVIGAIVLLPRPASPTAVAPSPSPTTSATTAATTSPTATATASPAPTATSGRFVNAELGYSMEVPSPWHRADCGSFKLRAVGQERDARDVLIPIPDYDYRPTDTGAPVDQVYVFARGNDQGLTPRGWEQAGKIGFSVGRVLEDVTFAGRPALRAGGSAEFETFLVAEGALMFEVAHAGNGGQTTPASRAAILRTFRFLTPDELRAARTAPTPAPLPPRSPEEVADALAEGFARRDLTILARILTPTCVSFGFAGGGGTASDDMRYLDELRVSFARGLTVTVQPRPLTGERTGPLPTLHARSTWREPGQPDQDVDLMISPEGATWYWRGNVLYAPGRR